jgi:hypothetical protein
VVELADRAPPLALLRELRRDAAPGQAVQDAELPLPQPLVDDPRQVEAGLLEGDVGVCRARTYGEVHSTGGLLVRRLLGDPPAERPGLPLAELGQRHVDVAVLELQALVPAGLRGVRAHVAGALAVPDDPEAAGQGGVRTGARKHGLVLAPRGCPHTRGVARPGGAGHAVPAPVAWTACGRPS